VLVAFHIDGVAENLDGDNATGTGEALQRGGTYAERTRFARDDQANWPPSQWLVDMEWPWAVMADSETQDAAVAMGVSGYPGLVLLDGDGTVLARRSGEASVSELNDWVSTALPSA